MVIGHGSSRKLVQRVTCLQEKHTELSSQHCKEETEGRRVEGVLLGEPGDQELNSQEMLGGPPFVSTGLEELKGVLTRAKELE